MQNKICVYAITKNEEKFVDKWYESMKEADSIVVLDTGSTDNTVQKLRDKGVKVVVKTYKPWRFDTPRNDAMDLAPEDCNILISTDLDEVLHPGWAEPLRNNWNPAIHTRAQYKYIMGHDANGNPGNIIKYNKIHDRKWRWKYPVHELLYNIDTNSENYSPVNQLDLFNLVTLEHFPDTTKSRNSYLELLELREQEDPDDRYGVIYLLHEYCNRGFYDKAVNKSAQIIERFNDKLSGIEKADCYRIAGDAYKRLGKYDEAEKVFLKELECANSYMEPYMDLARLYNEVQKLDLAIKYARDGLNKAYRHYDWFERDVCWSYEPYDLLCLAYFYSGKKIESLACAIKALSYDPNNQRLKDNVDCIIKAIPEDLY